MEKNEIRNTMKEQKSRLSARDISSLSGSITEKVLELPEFINAKAVYSYIEFNQEVSTRAILAKAWEMGKKVAVPKTVGKTMKFCYIESFDDVKPGYMGILEPVESLEAHDTEALMIMPGLAFDRDFNRIGYGGGFYDSYFEAHKNTHFIKAALGYDFQIVESIEHEEHDVPVDMIITPTRLYCR